MTGTGDNLWIQWILGEYCLGAGQVLFPEETQPWASLTLPPCRMMIQEGWVRRCQHTHLWIHACKRPSDCASRKRLQSARADTDHAEGIHSRLKSLPWVLISGLRVPQPVWADLETTPQSLSCHIHRERVLQGLCLAASFETSLSCMPIHLTSLWSENFLEFCLTTLVFWKQRLQRELKLTKT